MSISGMRKRIYRSLKYRLSRPLPPTMSSRFAGPVVVVGSAPVSHVPTGFNDSYHVVTINGAQFTTEAWGVRRPDATLLQFSLVEGMEKDAVEVRRVLNGKRTGNLFVLPWRKHELKRLRSGLQSFNYSYDRLVMVDRYERIALLDKVAGTKNYELDTASKCSNGMNGILFALYNGATAVIMSGINPTSDGHAYNLTNQKRLHSETDTNVLRKLMMLGQPIYTADPLVAEKLAVPLWNGESN